MDIHEIDGVQIHFDSNWKKIAISLSGGADSTLLTYLLCDIINKRKIQVHIINHIRMWKTRPWQRYDAPKVLEHIKNVYNDIDFVIHRNFIAPDVEYGNMGPNIKDEYGKMVSGDNAQIRSFSEFVCYENNIDSYYNAVTRNPKNVDFVGMRERDIERNDHNKHLEIMEHMGKTVMHPFRFIDKSWVVRQYKRLNIMDLFEKTRSCEGEFEDIDYRSYIPYQIVPTCGNCFWCKEREWAIEQSK